ncbi:hypothetical protein TRICI_000130 [Trichomonascus ciferrii]|uniref:Large ribosomal subunit protein bL28m n=1 Tax=Trichomonascus ciferrii TaxID=44093 RepID=A0A642VE70_9ASCO|nr:hypothetical protein TRICI_000130 [Trichomonascus ciferrii]
MLFGGLRQSLIQQPNVVRSFSTSTVCNRLYAHVVRRKVKQEKPLEEGDPAYLLPREKPEFPKYPYGEATLYKQSNRGLYGGKMIQFGHKISEFKNRNGRTFKPNVNRQTLWSEALQRKITLRVATSVLRTITKEGGLDNYLIQDTSARIKELGPMGWRLRYLVLKKLEDRERSAPKPIDVIVSGKNRVNVYAKYMDQNGTQLNVTCGRNKLLQELYHSLKQNQRVDELKQFKTLYRPLTTFKLLEKLENLQYDLTKVSQKA